MAGGRGGVEQYVEPLARPFREKARLSSPVDGGSGARRTMWRSPSGRGGRSGFDQVVLACHSDQALAMLADPTDTERELLSAIPYQRNDTVLHTDGRLLPKMARARASWNVHIPREERGAVSLTYWMNKLQRLDPPADFCVTLNNPDAIAPERVVRRMVYHHPVYSEGAFLAQKRRDEISGVNAPGTAAPGGDTASMKTA
jgi:predicted NAD/FAD-binding protein